VKGFSVLGVKPSTRAAVDAAASATSLHALVKRTVGASRFACGEEEQQEQQEQ
jgi:hypothetical protein